MLVAKNSLKVYTLYKNSKDEGVLYEIIILFRKITC